MSLLSNLCQHFIGLWQQWDETGNGHLCAQQHHQQANVNRSGANAPVCGFRETPTEKNVLFARNWHQNLSKSNQNLSWVSEYLIFRLGRNHANRNSIFVQLYNLNLGIHSIKNYMSSEDLCYILLNALKTIFKIFRVFEEPGKWKNHKSWSCLILPSKRIEKWPLEKCKFHNISGNENEEKLFHFICYSIEPLLVVNDQMAFKAWN